jgi:membrane protease YdiL (CAAX protease family)
MNLKLALFVAFAFVFMALLAFAQVATNLSFEIIVLPQLAPTLAFILTVLIFRSLYKPIIININKKVLLKAFIAIIFPLALFSIAYFIGKIIGIEEKIPVNVLTIIGAGIIGFLIGSIMEEIGWRSFFQPSLEKKHSRFISSLIVGAIWGIWHIGHFQNGLLFMLGFIIFTISVSIILAYLSKDTNYNIIISSLFHLSINIGFAILFNSGFVNTGYFLILSLVWLMSALAVTIFGRKYLFG